MRVYAIENHPNDSRVTIDPNGIVQTLSSRMGTGGNNTPFVLITSMKADSQSGSRTPSQACEPKADHAETEVKGLFVVNSSGDGIAAPIDASYYKGQGLRQGIEREYVMMKVYPKTTGTLCANSHPGSYTGQDAFNNMLPIIERDRNEAVLCREWAVTSDTAESCDEHAGLYARSKNHRGGGINMNDNSDRKYVLRRLTPIECARLQGFPDWWCDGADGSDSAQYKLWGNGVALPCVAFIMDRIVNGGKHATKAD